jgi:hypothetical protein
MCDDVQVYVYVTGLVQQRCGSQESKASQGRTQKHAYKLPTKKARKHSRTSQSSFDDER